MSFNFKRKFFCVCVMALASALMLTLTVLAAGAALAAPSREEMKRMGIFISNFTEVGLFNIDIRSIESDELIHFGIWHNYINNRKSTIKKCMDRRCEYGDLTVSGSSVAASIRRYFDRGIKHHSVDGSDFSTFYDGKLYHFAAADGGVVYYADVQEVTYEGNNTLRMSGEIYNLKNKSERPATFTALAKPHKWNNKDTWAILSLRTAWD